jgi:hypothetical protein
MKMEIKTKIQVRIFILEASLFALAFLLLFPFILKEVNAAVGGNVTMISGFTVGASAPIINKINIEGGGPIVLIPNSTRTINCTAQIEDFDLETDIKNVTARLFHNSSSYNSSEDNNTHYTNNSCYIDASYGDGNTVLAHCHFSTQYYANPGTWNCTVNVTDYSDYSTIGTNSTIIASLLALGLPTSLDYGIVNGTYVSGEGILNVTNYGNVRINLSLSGYARNPGDNLSMNCSSGGNISIASEKFNLTTSTPGSLSLSSFEAGYTNLTSSPTNRKFNLNYRQNDTQDDAINSTYWRIYVPRGIGGTCQGNIVFGAVVASGG